MSALIPFDFGFNTVRVIAVDGVPMFMARDVAVALGYSNPLEAIRTHCKTTREVAVETASGTQRARMIEERDVYRLVMRSKLHSAEAFEEWVVGEVLPGIRKTGSYTPAFGVPSTLSEALRLAADQAEQIEEGRRLLEEQRPAVEFAHAIRDTNDSISIGDMARVLTIGQNRFFARLRDDAILTTDNRPYQRFIDRGYFRVIENVRFDSEGEPHPTFKTVVTGRGQVFLQRRYGVVTEAAV